MATTLEMYEEIGDLFYRDTGCLRPGKSDPLRDTSTEENQQRFLEWYRLRSMECAIDRIGELKRQVEKLESRIDELEETNSTLMADVDCANWT